MNSKKRIPYFDVAKGMLICLVIISHIYLETLTVAKIPNSTFAWMRSWQWIHVSFFMPAFFIITGLCSNFEKEFKPFFISNVRTILIPAIVFDLLFFTIPCLFMGQDPWIIVMTGFVKRALAFGGVFWFFHRLCGIFFVTLQDIRAKAEPSLTEKVKKTKTTRLKKMKTTLSPFSNSGT